MNSFMKKTAALLGAIIMASAMVTGCEDKKDSSTSGDNMFGENTGTADESELPYGATFVELSKDYDSRIETLIEVDRRFFNVEPDDPQFDEIVKIHDYVKALNKYDSELMESLFYPGFLDSIAAANGLTDAQGYSDAMHKYLVEYLTEDFNINYIDVSLCCLEKDPEAVQYFSDADAHLIAAAGEDILDKVTSRKYIEIGGYTCFTNESGTLLLAENADKLFLCVYMIDGKAYLVY